MIVAPVSPEAPCVDAARDSLYCPQDIEFIPQAAPRGVQPPTPKPRSGIKTLHIPIYTKITPSTRLYIYQFSRLSQFIISG